MSPHQEAIRVLVADDHPVMRSGLRSSIESEADMSVVGEAADGEEAIALYRFLRPDVALVDLQMPNVDGLAAIASIAAEFSGACIVVLTTYPGDARVKSAMQLGAMSYLLKTACAEEVICAIRRALAGQQTIDPAAARELAAHRGDETLTPRELSVLKLVAWGKSNRAIADQLFVTEDAVKARMKSILAKLGAEDRTHAVTIAMRRGFLDN